LRKAAAGPAGVVGIFLGLLVSLLAAGPSSAAELQLRLVRERTVPSAPLRFKVYVSSPVPLGAYTLQLSFDPAILELQSLDGGSGEFAGAPTSNPERFHSGVVRFSAFQPARMDGPMGLCHVATATFRPRVARGKARLEVQAITVADTAGAKYHVPKRRKTVRFGAN